MTEKQSKPQKKQKRITPDYLRNAGLYYLQRFAASEANFRRVMERKILKSAHDHPDQDLSECRAWLEDVVVAFRRLGYLQDHAYALGFTRSLRQKGWPRARIINRLRQQGLDDEAITKAFEDPENDVRDCDQALAYARRKKIGPYRAAHPADFYQKDLAALARAGFSYEIAQYVLNHDITHDL